MAATIYKDEKDRILPGENGLMNFVFRVPMVIEEGDRFVLLFCLFESFVDLRFERVKRLLELVLSRKFTTN